MSVHFPHKNLKFSSRCHRRVECLRSLWPKVKHVCRLLQKKRSKPMALHTIMQRGRDAARCRTDCFCINLVILGTHYHTPPPPPPHTHTPSVPYLAISAAILLHCVQQGCTRQPFQIVLIPFAKFHILLEEENLPTPQIHAFI